MESRNRSYTQPGLARVHPAWTGRPSQREFAGVFHAFRSNISQNLKGFHNNRVAARPTTTLVTCLRGLFSEWHTSCMTIFFGRRLSRFKFLGLLELLKTLGRFRGLLGCSFG